MATIWISNWVSVDLHRFNVHYHTHLCNEGRYIFIDGWQGYITITPLRKLILILTSEAPRGVSGNIFSDRCGTLLFFIYYIRTADTEKNSIYLIVLHHNKENEHISELEIHYGRHFLGGKPRLCQVLLVGYCAGRCIVVGPILFIFCGIFRRSCRMRWFEILL